MTVKHNSVPNRVQAYSINIAGSIAGIVLFFLSSWLQLSPLWWFSLVALGLAYFLFLSTHRPFRRVFSFAPVVGLALIAMVTVAAYTPIHNQYEGQREAQNFWSPYYRIDFKKADLSLSVNLIYHQQMVSRSEVFPAYALPHLLNRDSGRPAFKDVMIIGAGSGNDVSRALQWGADHVDAVEIDPAINRLGRQYHPDHPYQDPRVEIHLDDGRNFLRATERKYDLIVYALVDSLVLHSGYSNIRLESYLFTKQAFADVQRHLKPGGTFVIYNYFRQGWLAARLKQGLEETFGAGNPLVLTLPYRQVIEPETATFGDFTVFFAGDTGALRAAFAKSPDYFLRKDQAPSPDSPNGFGNTEAAATPASWERFGLTNIAPVPGGILGATDDWPFLYLRGPMIPTLSLRGAAIMAALGLLLIAIFLPRRKQNGSNAKSSRSLNIQMFFLGAGFMLVETKAVVTMALLFGSTWVVNSIVFFAVLVMILLANLLTLKLRASRLGLYYGGLFITLLLNAFVSLDFFLGMNRTLQVLGACLLVFAPILFAGLIFAALFKRTAEPDRSFGFNIAGAMIGGLAEYSSMLLGFQYLVLVAILFYALSAVASQRRSDEALPAGVISEPPAVAG